jgi:4-amino-4-deoxy-L-arabinose transferase-like glycosyltransferase
VNNRWCWLLFALVALFYCLLGVRGISGPWHWGHNGYMGATFSQAAKNSARFGIIGQAPYHYDREPPPASKIYTHHPLGLHAHLVASFALFGTHEGAARLIPYAYSVAAWLMLMLTVRRFWGDRTACLAGLAYALTPLNLIFANMVSHQQGGIFACLCLLYAYLRWQQSGRLRYVFLCGAGVTLATQFDWPGYYVAFAVAAHCLTTGFRGSAPPAWRWFLAVFSGLTLANLFAFFAWIYITQSGIDEMVEVFRFRNRMPPPGSYLALLWQRVRVLHGPVLLPAAAIGAIGGLLASKARPMPSRALIPLAFFFAGLVQVLVFPQAAELHSYWIYYWSPALAICAALGLELLSVRFAILFERSSAISIPQRWSAPILALLFTLTQGSFAWRTWLEQLDHGHAADCDDCYFQRFERLWFPSLAGQFDRRAVRYALHSSIRDPRPELHYYLDAPYRRVERVHHATENEVVLVDRENLDPRDRSVLNHLARKHATVVWMDRFYAIDLRNRAPDLVRYEAVPDEPGLVEWWLNTQSSDPPLRWEPRP